MKTSALKVFSGGLIIFIILSLITGCSLQSTETASPAAGGPVNYQVTVDPIAQNILTSLNNNDYNGFSSDFDQTLKGILNKKSFDQLYTRFKTSVGDYQSAQFVSATKQNSAVTVLYVAHFSDEPAGVMMTLVLQSNNGVYQVQGLNFNSPNLAGQPIDLNKLKAYAGPETENILVSLNNNDYAGFSKDFNQVMQNAISQTGFDKLYSQIKSTVGAYQSKKFESANTQNKNNITTVIYLAEYTLEPAGVWVTISFDSNQKVAGLYFSSSRLQQEQSQ